MIELTRMNGTKFMLNYNLIGTIEDTPDTVITLTDGKKYIVKESSHEIRDMINETIRGYFTANGKSV